MTLQEFANANGLNSSMSAGAFFGALASNGIQSLDYCDADISEFLGLARSSGTVGMAKAKYSIATKSARGTKRAATEIKPDKKELSVKLTEACKAALSKIFKDTATYIEQVAVGGNTIIVNPELCELVQKRYDNDATFEAVVGYFTVNDCELLGIETPAMKTAAAEKAALQTKRLNDAKELVRSAGYAIINQTNATLCNGVMVASSDFSALSDYFRLGLFTLPAVRASEELTWNMRQKRLADLEKSQLEKAEQAALEAMAVAAQQIKSVEEKAEIEKAALLAEKQAMQNALDAQAAELAQLKSMVSQIMAAQASKPAKRNGNGAHP